MEQMATRLERVQDTLAWIGELGWMQYQDRIYPAFTVGRGRRDFLNGPGKGGLDIRPGYLFYIGADTCRPVFAMERCGRLRTC